MRREPHLWDSPSTTCLLISVGITKPFGYICIGFALTIVARLVVVCGLTPITNKLAPQARVESADKGVMFWGGLRGAVPLALALGLPAEEIKSHRSQLT